MVKSSDVLGLVPSALAARLNAAANVLRRSPQDVLRDAVDAYLRNQPEAEPAPKARRTAAEAAARLRNARATSPCLDDAELRDLI